MESFLQVAAWMNKNEGLLSVVLFLATLFLGWASGIFASLRRKPEFKIRLIDGPTFCCIYETGGEKNGHKTHQVAFALYLRVSNIGSAASSLEAVHVGYHWDIIPFSKQWWQYGLGWFWLDKLSVSLEDFQVKIGDSVKVFPFLFQKTHLSQLTQDTYLEPGKSVLGVVYFEQAESWGACQPRPSNGMVHVKLRLEDTFGGLHFYKANIPLFTLEEARKFNPSFGKTLCNLSGTTLPFDGGV
jgi:hypothetical protein